MHDNSLLPLTFIIRDPVWGAGFANLILGEALGWNGIIGASLITLAAVGTAILDLNQHTTIDQKNNQ